MDYKLFLIGMGMTLFRTLLMGVAAKGKLTAKQIKAGLTAIDALEEILNVYATPKEVKQLKAAVKALKA